MGPQHVTPKFSLHQKKTKTPSPKNGVETPQLESKQSPNSSPFYAAQINFEEFLEGSLRLNGAAKYLGSFQPFFWGTAVRVFMGPVVFVRNVEASCWQYRVGPLKHLVYNYLGVEMRALNRKVSDDSLLKGWSTKGNEVGWNHDIMFPFHFFFANFKLPHGVDAGGYFRAVFWLTLLRSLISFCWCEIATGYSTLENTLPLFFY